MRIHLTTSHAALLEVLVRTELLAVMASDTTDADKLEQTAALHEILSKFMPTAKPEAKRKPKAA